MQSCGFPLVLLGCEIRHQQRQASSYSPQTLLTSCLKVLRLLQYLLVLGSSWSAVLWKVWMLPASAPLLLTGYLSSDYHRAALNFLGVSVRYCTTVITRAYISQSSHGGNFEGLRVFHLEMSFLGAQQFCCLGTQFKQHCRKHWWQRCCRHHWTEDQERWDSKGPAWFFHLVSRNCCKERRTWHGTSSPQVKEKWQFLHIFWE